MSDLTHTKDAEALLAGFEPHAASIRKVAEAFETVSAAMEIGGFLEAVSKLKVFCQLRRWKDLGYETLDAFTKDRLGFADITLRRFLKAQDIRKGIKDAQKRLPQEQHAIALDQVPEESREATLDLADELAAKDEVPRTRAHVAKAAAVAKQAPPDELTEGVREALLAAEDFRVIQRQALALKREVAALAATPIGAHLAVPRIETDVRNIREALKFAMPYKPCCYCRCGYTDGFVMADGCKACGDKGWIIRPIYDAAPDDLKKGAP